MSVLRFKGFHENLESITLESVISQVAYGPRFSADDYDKGGNVRTIRGTDMGTLGEIKYLQVPTALLADKTVKSHQLSDGDLVMITTADCGITSVYRKQNIPHICSAYAVRIQLNRRAVSDYLKYFFQTATAQYEISRFIRKATVANLPASDIARVRINLPTTIEQKKIADFLTSIDTKISQLTEKHRLLKEYKKGVMQQVFSQKIRFKDESGNAFPEWKDATIGDIMTESRIKGSGGDKAQKLTVKIKGKGVIAKKDDGKGSENTQYYKRKAGQLIYGKLDFLNSAFAIIPESLDGYESTLDLPSLDVCSSVNKYFVLETVKQRRFYKRYGDIADGSRKAKRINVGVFQAMPITLPHRDEQDKIMSFWNSIDRKIEAVEEQIEQTKQFKKGLLQQMFV